MNEPLEQFGQLGEFEQSPAPFDMGQFGDGEQAPGSLPQPPPPPVYNLQPPMGISVTTPATVPQAYQPQQLLGKQQNVMLGSGSKGPDLLSRVQMGLQSGVRSEIDWSLSTLLTFTTARSFDALKSRMDVLDLVIDYIYSEWDLVTAATSPDDDSYASLRTRQKVLEALLIIRNVCLDPTLAQTLAPRCGKFVESGVALPRTSAYTEMRLLCLEVCEHVCFFVVQSSDSSLFKSLVNLLTSDDKSVLVTSLRSLSRLCVFDSKENNVLITRPKTLKRLSTFLLIDDPELDAAVLDLMVQYTSRLQRVEQLESLVPSGNPSLFAQHLVRLLSFRMDREPSDYLRLPRRTRRPAPVVPPEIPPYIMQELLAMNEPERATMWIQSSYDSDPDGEVLQVSLWSSYQRLFEPHERDGSGKRLLKAIDFIRTATTNVRGAQAKVVSPPEGPKKFIIKGLVPREKAIAPSQLLMNPGQQTQTSVDEKPSRPPPVYGITAMLVLTNIANLQGGKELLRPLIPAIVEAAVVNPSLMERVDKLLGELDNS